ncbi:hypothetical protein [Deinococcus cellulosilyticus]|uniref:Uncharacterized protein n=1 Tax=Deinococcus cellulosilyticus (strain DSM 18568 / NBRC 106333 / KACC 11606 / 5516J-15) TaxID=1223518 RepID=A0A511N7X6_DEIC1|nr:hypothetical protein [Deinococcus cellulosilyticus]GEM48588.1 hypothetical protein DC3_42230 [Deinococcus cellulosilyticus NBRC 106333 = KACC 11606]
MLQVAVLSLSGMLLFGCAPQQTAPDPGKVAVTVTTTKASFYPHELGLQWEYLLTDDRLDAPTYRLSVEGGTLFGDQATTRFLLTGRGTQREYFRTYDDTGVYLHGMTVPGAKITLVPALREYPGTNDWKVGVTWSGKTQITLFDDKEVRERLNVDYKYTVLEQRTVTLNTSNRTYQVWVINRQMMGAKDILPESKEFYFVPYIGEVLTPDGFVIKSTTAGR